MSFIHHSLFEFLLTQSFVAKFERDGRFGLDRDSHSVRVFDSLLPYFLRSEFGNGYEDELVSLVSSPSTTQLDRLLSFFFLEDHPSFLQLLEQMGSDYREFLLKATEAFESYFMRKIVRFQLVILDSGIGQALAYVSDARVTEYDTEQDIEVHTFASGKGPTEFLLNRIDNPNLQSALPITVYRLGQFGDQSAITRLRQVADTHADPCLAALAAEAVGSIEARHENNPNDLRS